MNDAQSPDTDGGQETAVPSTLQEALERKHPRIAAAVRQHGGQLNDSGQLLMPARTHEALGNKDIVKDLGRTLRQGGYDLSTMWERTHATGKLASFNSNNFTRFSTLDIGQDSNGLKHVKNLVFGVEVAGTGNSLGPAGLELHWMRWNEDFNPAPNSGQLLQAMDDYSVDQRRRLLYGLISTSVKLSLETRFVGLRLLPDREFGIVFRSISGGVGQIAIYRTASERTIEKGGF